MSWAYQPILPAAQLLTQTPPTVALNSPADASSDSDTTPTLDFTGTDAQSNDIRYNVQIATSAFVDLTCESLDTNVSNGTLSDFSTASISPAANKLVLLWFMVKNSSSVDPTDPSSVVGNGLTWVQVNKIVYDTTTTSRRTLFVYRSMGASPSSGAITVTFGETESGVIWGVDQFTGADTSGTNGSGAIVQSLTDSDESTTADAMTITLSAFGNPANGAWGVFGDSDQNTFTAGSGFTLISNTADATVFSRVASEFSSSADPTVDISLSGAADNLGGIAIEIKAATQIISDKVSGTDSGFANPDGTVLATDPFTRADNSSAGMNLGASWTASVPNYDLGISSNQAYQTVNTSDNVAFNNAVLANNQYVQAKMAVATTASSGMGVIIRASATDYVMFQQQQSSNQCFVYWYNGGAYTQIGSTYSGKFSDNDIIRLEARGTTIKAYINGVLVISGANASIPSSGKAGILLDENGDRIDDFECGDLEPYNSGENIQYTVQAGDALAVGTYYWRVRGIDPSGSNSYGAWSSARSFTITAGGGTSVKDLIGGFIPFAR